MKTSEVSKLQVAVCIASFRRPDRLAVLLVSLARQRFSQVPAPDWRVIVIDNDADGSARPACDAFTAVRLDYVREPRQGLSYARNAAIVAALDLDVLAFIDDDEIASEQWLDSLLKVRADSGAEAVVGSVTYVLPETAPAWVQRGGFFKSLPLLGDGTEALARGSHNLMLACDFLRRSGMRFDLRFNRAGGEDEFFFRTAIRAHGLRVAAAPAAVVEETVPANRVTLGWLLRRKFRYGNTLARCEVLHHAGAGSLLVRAMKGAGRMMMGVVIAAAGCVTIRADRTASGLAMSSFGLGMIAGLGGFTQESYTPDIMKAETV